MPENLILLSETTLYYFFSTLAQVLAAIVALIAVIIHFRISSLRDFLIGDGRAVLSSVEQRHDGFDMNAKYKNRLIHAIGRGDIGGLKNVIKYLADQERNFGYTLEEREKGLQFILKSFTDTENQINLMIKISKRAFIWALTTSFISVIMILIVDYLANNQYAQIAVISFCIILICICSYYLFKGMALAFKNFTYRFENDN